MIRRYWAMVGVVIFIGSVTLLTSMFFPSVPTGRTPPMASKPVATRPLEPADLPAPRRLNDHSIDLGFLETHNRFVARARQGNIELLFLGDSITARWDTVGADSWAKHFATYRAANFGGGSDRTQDLLWKIDNGELDGIHPKVVVLLMGTNNTNYPADDIIRANRKIVGEIREKLPQAKLLVLGIFPREYSPTDPVRLKIERVNSQLEKLGDGSGIRYLDIGGIFLTPSGTISIDLMPDFLHPSARGYQAWAEAIQPLLNEMMK